MVQISLKPHLCLLSVALDVRLGRKTCTQADQQIMAAASLGSTLCLQEPAAPKSLVCSAMAPKNQGQEPAAPKTASKGEGMYPTAVSRMLGLLKYRSDPDKNKKGQ